MPRAWIHALILCAGSWLALPAYADTELLYKELNLAGGLYTVEAATGRITHVVPMPPHGWSSPAVIGGDLLVAACDGTLWRFALDDPARPRPVWSFRPSGAGCWESTPAVWEGIIYLGNRDGHVYAIGEGPPLPDLPRLASHAPALQ